MEPDFGCIAKESCESRTSLFQLIETLLDGCAGEICQAGERPAEQPQCDSAHCGALAILPAADRQWPGIPGDFCQPLCEVSENARYFFVHQVT